MTTEVTRDLLKWCETRESEDQDLITLSSGQPAEELDRNSGTFHVNQALDQNGPEVLTNSIQPANVRSSMENSILERPRGSRRLSLKETMSLKAEDRHMLSRDKWFKKCCMVVDIQFGLMAFGLVMMVVENELYIHGVYDKTSLSSILVKSTISATTVCLLICIVVYEAICLKITMMKRQIDDWRIIVDKWHALFVVIQLVVCSIHPIPGDIKVMYYPISGHERRVSIDAVLSIVMLLRLYIVGRLIVHHSFFMSDMCTRTLCALNKVQYDGRFVFKAMVSSQPALMIFAIMLGNLTLSSFAMHICESYYEPGGELGKILTSAWVVAMDSSSVEPNSYCGRFVAVTDHFVETCATALLIAIVSEKLMLTRAERYVSIFSLREKLQRKCARVSTDIVSTFAQIWLGKTRATLNKFRARELQRRLHGSVRKKQTLKAEIRAINDSTVGLVELHQSMDYIETQLQTLHNKQEELKSTVMAIYDAVRAKADTEIIGATAPELGLHRRSVNVATNVDNTHADGGKSDL